MGTNRNPHKADKFVFLTFFDKTGNVITKEWLSDKTIYERIDGTKYVYYTTRRRNRRISVTQDEINGIPCYVGHMEMQKDDGKRPRHHRSISLEHDQMYRIRKIARRDRINEAEVIRQLVEWGLEAAAEAYDLEKA